MPENWVLHHRINLADGFTQAFQSMGDIMVIERIQTVPPGFGMERRYAKLGQEWALIYYADMHQLSQ